MNGEAMLLIVFGIAIILLLSLILFFIVINPWRIQTMLSDKILAALKPVELKDHAEFDKVTAVSLDEAVDALQHVGTGIAQKVVANAAATAHNTAVEKVEQVASNSSDEENKEQEN